MKSIKLVWLLIVLVIPCGAKEKRNPFRDFSAKGPEYRLLDSLRLALPDIKYEGAEQVAVFGKSYLASKYTSTVEVEVQTLCAIGPNGGHQASALRLANYEIQAIEDQDRSLHDSLISTLYDLWSRKELCTQHECFDFNIEGREYLVSTLPATQLEGSFYRFWVHGRLFKITFKGFQNGGGWGPLSRFTSDILRIRLGDKEVSAYQVPLHVQERPPPS